VSRSSCANPRGESRVSVHRAGVNCSSAPRNYTQRVARCRVISADRAQLCVAGHAPTGASTTRASREPGRTAQRTSRPIAPPLQTQVYPLAEYLGVPRGNPRPSAATDTFSMPRIRRKSSYFALPTREHGLCLYAYNHGVVGRSSRVRGISRCRSSGLQGHPQRSAGAKRDLHFSSTTLVERVIRFFRGA